MTDETLGAQIRSARTAAGLTQVDLAKRAETTQPHLGAIERGAHEPTIDLLRRLAEALGCDWGYTHGRAYFRWHYDGRRHRDPATKRETGDTP